MELRTPMRFHATVLCWTQDSEVQKIEVSRSFAHNNPYLDFLQGANFAIFGTSTLLVGHKTQIRAFISDFLLTSISRYG